MLKEARRKREFVVPGQPRLEKGLDGRWRLILKKDEASLVQLETRNGFYLGEEIMSGYLSGSMRSGLSNWRAEDYVYEIPNGTRKLKFHAKVFETAKGAKDAKEASRTCLTAEIAEAKEIYPFTKLLIY